jgi:hypothetical protein
MPNVESSVQFRIVVTRLSVTQRGPKGYRATTMEMEIDDRKRREEKRGARSAHI